MRKLLLLLAGLLFSILPSSAQQKIADITSRVVTHSADLTSGYYILNCYSIDGTKKPNGSVLYDHSISNGRRIQYDYNGFINNDNKKTLTDSEAQYIWYVKQEEDDKFTIRNVLNNVYFPLDTDHGQNMATPETKEAARYTLMDKSGTDNSGNPCEGIVLKTTSSSNTAWSIFCNFDNSTKNNPTLSYWESGGNGELLFNFVEVQNVDYNITEYPFYTSAAPSNNEFNANTRWQFLTIKNKYLYYTNDDTYIQVTDNYSINDKYLWAFHINEDGKVVIYNKAAGATKVLAAGAMTTGEGDLSNGGGTYPKFVPASSIPEDQIAVWGGYKSFSISGKDGFFLYRGENKTERMNLRTAGSTNVLAFWTQGANEGSTFWVVPYVDYTIKCVNEEGETLQVATKQNGVGGTDITLPTFDFMVPTSAIYNGAELPIENKQITLPQEYGCEITVTYKNQLPFEPSPAPTTEGFAADTKWYKLKMNYGELVYDSENPNQVATNGTTGIDDKYWWAFVGNTTDGFKIYNRAAGAGKVLMCETSNSDPTAKRPRLISNSDKNENLFDTWTIYANNNSKIANVSEMQFFMSLKGETNKISIDNGTSGGGHFLKFWTGADVNSSFYCVAFNSDEYFNAVIEDYENAPVGSIGSLSATNLAQLKEMPQTTLSDYQNAIRFATENGIVFDQTKYYRLQTPGRNTKNYMTINSTSAEGLDLSAVNVSQVWKFTGDADNGYKLCAQGRYIGTPAQSAAVSNNTGEGAANFFIIPAQNKALYELDATGNNQYDKLHLDGNNYSIVGWESGAAASEWYLIPATSIDVNISNVGYATANYPFAVTLPKGLTAYTGEAISSTTFELREVSEGKIPANTPVILIGAPTTTYTLTIDTENTVDPITSDLSGTLLPETIAVEETVYGLANGNSGVGFYMLNDAEGANRTIGANKAYLNADKLPNGVQGVRGLTFSFSDDNGTTTGIESSVSETAKEEYYDLQGRRVMNPSKGIYVTKSGKKILFTK